MSLTSPLVLEITATVQFSSSPRGDCSVDVLRESLGVCTWCQRMRRVLAEKSHYLFGGDVVPKARRRSSLHRLASDHELIWVTELGSQAASRASKLDSRRLPATIEDDGLRDSAGEADLELRAKSHLDLRRNQ